MPPELRKPIEELRFLLDRGYPKSYAVKFISDHHRLHNQYRYILSRVVHSTSTVDVRRRKTVGCDELGGEILWIDGYNVIITVEHLITGEHLFLCDDGFLRDIKGVFRSYKLTESSKKSVNLILDFIGYIKPEYTYFILDEKISKSGELAGYIRRELKSRGMKGEVKLSDCVDSELKNVKNGIVATADGIIVDAVERVADLPMCV
ncbi:DUF434 domain-containing protein [Methanosarcinales archaeon]|nr:MAG: DUF434 domain-containing protein [Methanosarcinales archaeon]